MEGCPSLLDRINQLIGTGGLALPVFNDFALGLQKLGTDGTQDIREMERLIASDQAIAAEVLCAANSPFYGGLSTINTIRNAIVRLGDQQVRRLVVLAAERSKYRARNPELNRILQLLWKHASTTALAAQWLAGRFQAKAIEEVCFMGGLLHDIGQLVILRAMDEIGNADGPGEAISPSLMKEVLLTAHCQLGYSLLCRWNIPDVYRRIARDHHAEVFDPKDLPLTIVRLANEGSRKMGISLDPDPSIILSATTEANLLKAGDIMLAELEIMLEDHLSLLSCR